ncbi:MAG: DinB family protein [Dehalococcoidia bacterium]|jgi:uncharacterized damage-inducible protein DinB
MDYQNLLSDGYDRALAELEHVLEGLKPEDLNWQPRPDCNSIGWLAWHLTRSQDAALSIAMRQEQLWIKDGWHSRFNRPADPRDMGTGHTPEDVAAFEAPDVETLIGYHRAVLERSKQYFNTLTAEDLDRVLNMKWLPPLTTLGSFLIMIMADSFQHAGQAGYVRGLHEGLGWQKY